MKKISVVIPCHNVAEYLDRCMEHILKQTIGLENIEIIIVDDASTDGGATLSLIMEYEKRYPDNIMVIPLEQNLRQGGARNVGVSYASGEYLMFCDADDWLMLDAMEILYRTAKEYDADVVEFKNSEVTRAEGEGMETAAPDKIKYTVWDFNEDDEKKREFIIYYPGAYDLACWSKMYRLSMIQNNNIRFAEHLICEESTFMMPVRLYERKHVLMDAELYCYFRTPNSTMRSSWDDRKFDNIKVWMTTVQDLEERGLLVPYHDEVECMFYVCGIGMSISMLVGQGYMLSEEELNFFKKAMLQLFPDVCQNPYVVKKTDGWNMLMQALLEMELTKENVPELNRLMQYYLQRYYELGRQS